MMFTEDDLLPISALQHMAFCPRQCALIHVEKLWAENLLTAKGRSLHERTHELGSEQRPGFRIVRGLRLQSLRLGLTGQADVVEFHASSDGIELEGATGLWSPYPVEFKRGRSKPDNCDRVQLCAQAICIEEMLNVSVPTGALYYGKPRRREQIEFNASLRKETENLAASLHKMVALGITPKAPYGRKCKSCSLIEICMPKTTGVHKKIDAYLLKACKDDSETTA